MAQRHSKVLILGSGAAGLTAAIYTARAGLAPVLIHGMQPGGQMTITTDVENYPGFADVIQGPWLMEQMQAQAESVGTEMIADMIVEADLATRPFTLTGDSGDIILVTLISALELRQNGSAWRVNRLSKALASRPVLLATVSFP